MSKSKMIDCDEAVKLIMQRTGKNRRQAKADLEDKIRQGLLPATGINPLTGECEIIPPTTFPYFRRRPS
jgi:hypothetical protein